MDAVGAMQSWLSHVSVGAASLNAIDGESIGNRSGSAKGHSEALSLKESRSYRQRHSVNAG